MWTHIEIILENLILYEKEVEQKMWNRRCETVEGVDKWVSRFILWPRLYVAFLVESNAIQTIENEMIMRFVILISII